MVVKWFAGAVAPREGQGEQPHHFGQARGVGEVGILEVEAPGFEASEQGFHWPAVGVGVDGLVLGCAEGGQDEPLAVVQAQRGEVDEAAPDGSPSRQQVGLAGFERAQERVNPQDPVPVVGDEGVALDPLVEGNSSRLQPPGPCLAHEFAVGQQHGDPPDAKDGQEALHPGHALGGVGVARLAQDAPKQREGDPPIGDPQHQEIEVHPARTSSSCDPGSAATGHRPPARAAPATAPKSPGRSRTSGRSVATVCSAKRLGRYHQTRWPIRPG